MKKTDAKNKKKKSRWVEGTVQELLSLSDADMEWVEFLAAIQKGITMKKSRSNWLHGLQADLVSAFGWQTIT